MKRLCIYVIYDKESRIDNYVSYMLRGLKEVVSCLIVVCNMSPVSSGEDKLKAADKVFFRENKGYDTGAWKDTLCDYLKWELNEYNELILTNDSFYGPFYPFSEMFEVMEQSDADFWSITEHPPGEFLPGIPMGRHLQSYFTCIRKRMFDTVLFRDYWEEIKYPESLNDAIWNHEIVFTKYFEDKGFTSSSYIAEKGVRLPYGVCPFFGMNKYLISDIKMPVLKKKSLQFFENGYCDSLDAVEYIDKSTDYDINLIWENVYRLSRCGCLEKEFPYHKLDSFCKKWDRVFLYGAGRYGKRIRKYLEYRGIKLTGVFVSELTSDYENDDMILQYNADIIKNNDGIIVATGKELSLVLAKVLLERVDTTQLFVGEFS